MLRAAMKIGLAGSLLILVSACNGSTTEHTSDALLADRELAAVREWANPALDPAIVRSGQGEQLDSVGSMLAGLENRLQDNPEDPKGWSLLAQSYAFVGRMDEAYTAIDRAVALGAERAPLERRVHAAHGEGS